MSTPVNSQVNKDLALQRARNAGAKKVAAANVNTVREKKKDETNETNDVRNKDQVNLTPPTTEEQPQVETEAKNNAQPGVNETQNPEANQVEQGQTTAQEHPAVTLQRQASEKYTEFSKVVSENTTPEEIKPALDAYAAELHQAESQHGPATNEEKSLLLAEKIQKHALGQFKTAPEGSADQARWEKIGKSAHEFRDIQGKALEARAGLEPGSSADHPSVTDADKKQLEFAKMEQERRQVYEQIRQIWMETHLMIMKSMEERHKMLRDFFTWRMAQHMDSTLNAAKTASSINDGFNSYLRG